MRVDISVYLVKRDFAFTLAAKTRTMVRKIVAVISDRGSIVVDSVTWIISVIYDHVLTQRNSRDVQEHFLSKSL